MIDHAATCHPVRRLADAERTGAEILEAETELAGASLAHAAAMLKLAVLRSAVAKHRCSCSPTRDGEMGPESGLASDDGSVSATPLHPGASLRASKDRALVYVVDHDAQVRAALRRILEANGLRTEVFADGAAFLIAYRRQDNVCLLADTELTDLGGLALLRALGAAADPIPVIMITGSSDISMAVDAINAGAVDFIEKPVGGAELVASVMRALAGGLIASGKANDCSKAMHHFDTLTARQRQIMALVLVGQPSKNIAADLGISQRTVENHRAAIMRKSGSKSLPALARLALDAGAGLTHAGN